MFRGEARRGACSLAVAAGSRRTGRLEGGAPKYGAPKYGAPKYGAPKYGAPKCGAPKCGAPKYGAPKYGAPKCGAFVVGCVLLASLLMSCNRVGPGFQKMAIQPRYDPLEPSDFFADGMAARPRVAGTVARGEVTNNGFLETGKINGVDGDGFPFPVTSEVLNRGQERFDIFCSECHGRLADGNGMIPSRGFRRPPSFHTDILRMAKTGHFIDVMTNGFGVMPSHAAQVPVSDRWAIVAYIRALQLSQNATVADVPAANRADLDKGAAR